MKKLISLSFFFVSLMGLSCAVASPESDALAQCKASKHKPISEIKVPWGTPYAQAKEMLTRQYHGQGIVIETSPMEIQVNILPSKQKTFDMMSYKFKAGKFYYAGISYSDNFQSSLGGIFSAWKMIANKLIERYGEKADDVDTSQSGKVIANWNKHPVETELYGKDPNVIILKTQCTPLLKVLTKVQHENVDVGF